MVLRWLLGCLRSAEWRRLEARRSDFRGLQEPDLAATAMAVKSVEGRDRVAALRAVLAGSVVAQVIAAKWVGRSHCPRCNLEDEDWAHSFWRCPATAPARQRHGFRPVEEDLGPIGRGVLPRDDALERAARECGCLPQPLSGDFPDVVYTDGSVLDPMDPFLARGAWAVVWRDGDGWSDVTGPCPGAQASGRAELQAVLWAPRASRPPGR